MFCVEGGVKEYLLSLIRNESQSSLEQSGKTFDSDTTPLVVESSSQGKKQNPLVAAEM